MFKKLKDKLAEEVKSSPQRIQQFAQAAQAAVTSASSSISDITNNDLFSIGDGDTQTAPRVKPQTSLASLEPPSLDHPITYSTSLANESGSDGFLSLTDSTSRQRRLSNSSMASDVSFKFPTYETPSMYHLQSDLDISASEAEERTLASPGGMSLERVTKEQLYSAYRRTQERYAKYRAQYADLARHYKLLERENSKARSVLVETQDKALRRISELREQCALEQSAKAHLEQALRIEIDEKNDKIATLNTKIKLLKNNDNSTSTETSNLSDHNINENKTQLIDLSFDDAQQVPEETKSGELEVLNKKIEMMEQLSNKYKESMKVQKEKNAQLNTEILLLKNQIDKYVKENEELYKSANTLVDCKQEIKKLKEENEELQNKINTYEFSDSKKKSELELDFEKAKEKILTLQNKIDLFNKKEEEYAISLAENKLSIHKELESKESEIKSLKDSLDSSENEINSLKIVIETYKQKITEFKEENVKLANEMKELKLHKPKTSESESENNEYISKYRALEHSHAKIEESYKCLELQIKQETAEKLALNDRNTYLEERIRQLTDETSNKNTHITSLENDLNKIKVDSETLDKTLKENCSLIEEINLWKHKHQALESEILDEREELIKLQTEIEKMLINYNTLEAENVRLSYLGQNLKEAKTKIQEVKNMQTKISASVNSFIKTNVELTAENKVKIKNLLQQLKHETDYENLRKQHEKLDVKYKESLETLSELQIKYSNAVADLEQMKKDLLKSDETFSQVDTQQTKIKECKIENENLKLNIKELTANLKEISTTNELLLDKISEKEAIIFNIEEKNSKLQNELLEISKLESQLEDKKLEIEKLQDENITLQKVIDQCNINISELESQTKVLQEQCETTNKNMALIHIENKNAKEEISALKEAVQKSNDVNNKVDLYMKEITELQTQNYALKEINQELQRHNELISNELSEKRCEIEKENNKISKYKQQILSLTSTVTSVQKENDQLTQKIVALEKNQKNNIDVDEERKRFETEIAKYKTLQTTMETQNKNLLHKIDELNEQCNVAAHDTETLRHKCEQIKQEKEVIYEKVLSLEQKITEINESKDLEFIEVKEAYEKKINEIDSNYTNLKSEFQNQSIENKRLLSEIEGLQAFLKNLLNDNDELKEKLRSIISTDEFHNIDELQNEISEAKDKIKNLLKENDNLKEENVKIKDEATTMNSKTLNLHPQLSYSESEENKEQLNMLLVIKDELENKIANLELLNDSANRNINNIQDKNEKLKFNNQKLERRLDEALVSLRHLHSLQENTELEYLRNVLYEYLTGPGTHSITLAKVLAAVVKFDDQQTKHVLQREKERQGLLRQLGIS